MRGRKVFWVLVLGGGFQRVLARGYRKEQGREEGEKENRKPKKKLNKVGAV